jgi:hypothetical protein
MWLGKAPLSAVEGSVTLLKEFITLGGHYPWLHGTMMTSLVIRAVAPLIVDMCKCTQKLQNRE